MDEGEGDKRLIKEGDNGTITIKWAVIHTTASMSTLMDTWMRARGIRGS